MNTCRHPNWYINYSEHHHFKRNYQGLLLREILLLWKYLATVIKTCETTNIIYKTNSFFGWNKAFAKEKKKRLNYLYCYQLPAVLSEVKTTAK